MYDVAPSPPSKFRNFSFQVRVNGRGALLVGMSYLTCWRRTAGPSSSTVCGYHTCSRLYTRKKSTDKNSYKVPSQISRNPSKLQREGNIVCHRQSSPHRPRLDTRSPECLGIVMCSVRKLFLCPRFALKSINAVWSQPRAVLVGVFFPFSGDELHTRWPGS